MELEVQETQDVYIPQQSEHSNLQQSDHFVTAVQEIDDSQLLVGSAVQEIEEIVKEVTVVAVEMGKEKGKEVLERSRSGGKRKRGRLTQRVKSKPQSKPKKDEEDVCFICFDGGNLVICDRRLCPKAYHPTCINREESFFRSRGRWNCGWHICSKCEKPAQYMCYTCTYSLCKGCIKEAGFLCVRANKGFCETCMKTVMLIENTELTNKEMVQVDFDDKNCWEYLFKEYWLGLKGKLSLNLDELTEAKNPWKGPHVLARNEQPSDELYNVNNDLGYRSDRSSGHLEGSNSTRKKVKRQSKSFTNTVDFPSVKALDGEGSSVVDNTKWASKELLEFVAHMKGGERSVISQIDVQALLLEYIKRNSLHDPRRKSQIICDSRLQNLFGKARVGHFEMLKLLELHFFIKKASSQPLTDGIQQGNVDTEAIQMEAGGCSDSPTKTGSDKRMKTCKKIEERESLCNPDYAAIDAHNINLIYLRRNLMEDLIEDIDNFQDKVTGSFVRIRISSMGQKHDMYRLVQVVGTGKAAETYKTGKKTTDVTLEILNLDKTEIITIDALSNQEFSEEECKRLRQSIKCGFINRLILREVQEKARALQAVRVNAWLETELQRLNHLRDRASEKCRSKELREYAEKLQLLRTPEERFRRLQELPEVHVDLNMNPNYESEEDKGDLDDKKQDNYKRPRHDGLSPEKGGLASNETWNAAQKDSAATREAVSARPTKEGAWDKGNIATGGSERTKESCDKGRDIDLQNIQGTPRDQASAMSLETDARNNQIAIRSQLLSTIATETASAPLATSVDVSSTFSDTNKLWHYQDPSGKFQGPFSISQLRKWSSTGHFPADLRIWKTSEKQEKSILLTDALVGRFQKEQPTSEPYQDSFPQPQKGSAASDNRQASWEGGWTGNSNLPWTEKKPTDASWKSSQNEANGCANGNAELPKTVGWGTQSGIGDEGVEGNSGRLDSSQNHENTGCMNRPTELQYGCQGYEKQSSNKNSSIHSSGEGWEAQSENNPSKNLAMTEGQGADHGGRNENDPSNLLTPNVNPSSRGWTMDQGSENKLSAVSSISVHPTCSNEGTNVCLGGGGASQSLPTFATESKRIATGWGEQPPTSDASFAGAWALIPKLLPKHLGADQGGRNDLLNLPTPSTPSVEVWEGGQGAENESAANSMVSVPPTTHGWNTAPSPGGNEAPQSSSVENEPIKITVGSEKQSVASSVKPSVGTMDSGPVSCSALKSYDSADGHDASLITESDQLTHSSTSLPASLKPTTGADVWGASHISEGQQTALSEPGPSSPLANQSVTDMASGSNLVLSCGLGPSISDNKSDCDMSHGSENCISSPMHGSTQKPDSGKGDVLSDEDTWKVEYQFTMEDEELFLSDKDVLEPDAVTFESTDFPTSHGPGVEWQAMSHVSSNLLTEQGPFLEFVGSAPLATAAIVQPELYNNQVALLGLEDHQLNPDTIPSEGPTSAGTSMNRGVDLVSSDMTIQTHGLNGISCKPAVESHTWGSGSAQTTEVACLSPRSGLVSHGCEAAPSWKKEPASSVPKAALIGDGWGLNPSQIPDTASVIPSFSVSDSMACFGNWVSPPNTNGDLSMISTPLNANPSSWNGGPNPALGNNRNNSRALSDSWNPPTSREPWTTGSNIGPTPPTQTGWCMGQTGNLDAGLGVSADILSMGLGAGLGYANMVWGTSTQVYPNMSWGALPHENPSGNPSTGNSGMKQDRETFLGQAVRGFHVGDSGHGGGRPSWYGGGSNRFPSRGPKVCKYHQSGYCRKGTSCDFLHS